MLKKNKASYSSKSDVLLLFLFLATAAVILFRITAEGTGYISPDSTAYLNLAQNLKEGHGFYVLDPASSTRHYFSTWPAGYPVLIYLFSVLTSLNVFWASKILNLIILGLSFMVIRQVNHRYSFVLASVYCSYTLLEVYSFTWSEAPFLCLILLLVLITSRIWKEEHLSKNTVYIFIVCLLLFLMRYVGAFSFAVPTLLGLCFSVNKKHTLAIKQYLASLMLVISAGAYLYINSTLSGYTTGFDRLEDETETIGAFVTMLFRGLLNEFLIIREYRPQNQPDYLLYISVLVQVAALTFIAVKVKRHFNYWSELRQNSFSMICIGIALLYLASILALRLISQFDALDYRLLSPFSFPLLMGLVYTLASLPDRDKDVVQAKYALFAFFILSLILNLPKKFILQQIQQIM